MPRSKSASKTAVTISREPLVIPTYRPCAPDVHPMFLEKRVYQGSSGKVYPLPFTDRIESEKHDEAWEAVHLENEFLRVTLLPQLGGRIHAATDKTNGYDLFYRPTVIKPALVGLAGPWVSGGVEFNWPQHHRPSTAMPCEVTIESHPDGSRTVWLSEHEPLNRMKGMHGICLRPGSACIEVKVRAYNRTRIVQTFLWWANVATRVHALYQSFFPPDVHAVADHAKRATSSFPLCDGYYYGINYGARGRAGQRRKIGSVEYAANDLSWYANISVPTSYMCAESKYDFFGGYDHSANAGIVHVANHHISPGKKQWTWGNHPFGYAWDRNLTGADAKGEFPPYIELMAGVYTDNQPDFSYLMPGETKTWSQFWFPIQKIGPAINANVNAALSLAKRARRLRIGVAVTTRRKGVQIWLTPRGEMKLLRQWTVDIAPDVPFVVECELTKIAPKHARDLFVVVIDSDGNELISHAVPNDRDKKTEQKIESATEPPPPEKITSSDELYLTGLHLEQYRHATRRPEDYWRAGYRRDANDSRCHTALGRWHLRRGEWISAGKHLRAAIARLTMRNPNPYDGEAHYTLGQTLAHRAHATLDARLCEEAYAAFYKSTWNHAWQAAAFHALAELDCSRGDYATALDHLDRALRANADNLGARNLRVMVLGELGRDDEAKRTLRETRALDKLDGWSRWLAGEAFDCDEQSRMDIALDVSRAGFDAGALDVLGESKNPMADYMRAWFSWRLERPKDALRFLRAAAKASPDYCFPSRLEEIGILEFAMAQNPKDARAPYYLGNLFYDRRRFAEAIALWERAAKLDPKYSVVWRNLGIGYFNISKDPKRAKQAYEKAFVANPKSARVLFERDQLWKRLGVSPVQRMAELARHQNLVRERDDLSVEWCALCNQCGEPECALDVLRARKFQPWEGGEGQALGQFARAHVALAREALSARDGAQARALLEAVLTPPENLGETWHVLANGSEIWFLLGEACALCGDSQAAKKYRKQAAEFRGDFQEMSVRTFSEMTYFSALALRALGREKEAEKMLRGLLMHALDLERQEAKIDYFATSLPTMLLFDEDLQTRQVTTARFMQAQALLGLGMRTNARRVLADVVNRDPAHAFAAGLWRDDLRVVRLGNESTLGKMRTGRSPSLHKSKGLFKEADA